MAEVEAAAEAGPGVASIASATFWPRLLPAPLEEVAAVELELAEVEGPAVSDASVSFFIVMMKLRLAHWSV